MVRGAYVCCARIQGDRPWSVTCASAAFRPFPSRRARSVCARALTGPRTYRFRSRTGGVSRKRRGWKPQARHNESPQHLDTSSDIWKFHVKCERSLLHQTTRTRSIAQSPAPISRFTINIVDRSRMVLSRFRFSGTTLLSVQL